MLQRSHVWGAPPAVPTLLGRYFSFQPLVSVLIGSVATYANEEMTFGMEPRKEGVLYAAKSVVKLGECMWPYSETTFMKRPSVDKAWLLGLLSIGGSSTLIALLSWPKISEYSRAASSLFSWANVDQTRGRVLHIPRCFRAHDSPRLREDSSESGTVDSQKSAVNAMLWSKASKCSWRRTPRLGSGVTIPSSVMVLSHEGDRLYWEHHEQQHPA